MGKKSNSKRTQQPRSVFQAPMRSSPNWILLALSMIGIGLTGYLSYSAWSGGAVRGCDAGSGCDVVLTSRWAEMFGLPTAFWGMLAYTGLAGTAFIRRADTHWKYAWIGGLLGAAYSVYLTVVSLTVLDATCPYCLTSLALMAAILGVTTWQRPAALERFGWSKWLRKTIPLAAVFVLVLHLQYAAPVVPDDPRARSLAEHLTKVGAKFYGASWCDHCSQQKRIFGSSASRLPYVECSPGGQRAPQAQECRALSITTYPTWIINGQKTEGVLSLTELANSTGFQSTSSQ
jgi:uncharacterized membrane protein/glutaredoxin